jgi:hypothetical protein
MRDFNLCRKHSPLSSSLIPAIGLGNHHYVELHLFNFIQGGVHLGKIHASYPYIMFRMLGPRYRWSRRTCLDIALCPIHLDIAPFMMS